MAQRVSEEENIWVGQLLQRARESRGFLQSEMCDATGLTKNHISAIERGVSKASVHMLLGYCRKLNMSPNEILGFPDVHIDPELVSLLNSLSLEEQRKLATVLRALKQ